MLLRLSSRFLIFTILLACATVAGLPAQGPPTSSSSEAAPAMQANTTSTAPVLQSEQVTVPTGTRLPLLLRNGINTRTAKPGDSVYFETVYPMAHNNRIVIPIGSFVRGRILQAKRPGLINGRGEFRIVLD